MKKIFLPLAIVLVTMSLTQVANAQSEDGQLWRDRKHQISAGFGAISSTMWAGWLGKPLVSCLEDTEDVHFHYSGTFNLAYQYNINQQLTVGLGLSYERIHAKKKYHLVDDYHFVSVMPRVRLYWLHAGDHVSLYSKVALGCCFVNYTVDKDSPSNRSGREADDTACTFGYQLTPVGAEFGGQDVRAFAEFGTGVEGFAQAGIRYSF